MIGLIHKDWYCLKKNLLLFLAVTLGIIELSVLFTVSTQTENIAKGVEAIKAGTPMEWVEKMNCIRQQAEEIILNELIYI